MVLENVLCMTLKRTKYANNNITEGEKGILLHFDVGMCDMYLL